MFASIRERPKDKEALNRLQVVEASVSREEKRTAKRRAKQRMRRQKHLPLHEASSSSPTETDSGENSTEEQSQDVNESKKKIRKEKDRDSLLEVSVPACDGEDERTQQRMASMEASMMRRRGKEKYGRSVAFPAAVQEEWGECGK